MVLLSRSRTVHLAPRAACRHWTTGYSRLIGHRPEEERYNSKLIVVPAVTVILLGSAVAGGTSRDVVVETVSDYSFIKGNHGSDIPCQVEGDDLCYRYLDDTPDISGS